MNPPIEQSVICTRPNRWLLGTRYVCDVLDTIPNDAIAHWQAAGNTYCIRTSTADVDESLRTGDTKSNLCHHAGTSAAVWNFGGIFVKVKAWQNGMQLESDTIQFVNRMSSIPTPEIIYSWRDEKWDRSFLILRALEGNTLAEAWGSLTTSQRTSVADTIAKYCDTLALLTSERLETANGNAVLEPFLAALPPASHPSWKPQTFGPLSSTELQSILSRYADFEGHLATFNFYHADLGPKNILVARDGSIAGVIDWESAAYYPKFWLGTKPLVSAGFQLPGKEGKAWAFQLARSLEKEGFLSDMQKYQAWQSAFRT